MKILFIDSIHPLLQEELEKKGCICHIAHDKTKKEIEKIISNYTGVIIRSRFNIDTSFLNKAKNLKFIARAGSGLENINVKYAESKNIICINAPEGNKSAVAEHAIALILSLFNNIKKSDFEIRKNIWLREENRGVELEGKTIGIIGYGNTGSALAKILNGFNVRILAYDKYLSNHKHISSMQKIYEQADIISLHVPLNKETKYLVNTKFINRCKKPFYLINTSRGLCVKTKDLVTAMKNEKIKGACLDVLEYETTCFNKITGKKSDNQDIKYLLKSKKTILSSHIAGLTYESKIKISEVLLEKIKKFI